MQFQLLPSWVSSNESRLQKKSKKTMLCICSEPNVVHFILGGYGYAAMASFPEIHQMAYLTASLCCVGALGGLSSQKTSRLGNTLGIVRIEQ